MSDSFQSKRINKYLADRGLCSRREAEVLILKGWVKVNNQVVTELATKILPTDQVDVDLKAQDFLAKKVTILINKPVGFVSAQAEDGHRPAIELIDNSNYFGKTPPARLTLKGLAPVGRLDIDSKGLLILSQDGKLAKKIIGPESDIEKEYIVGTNAPASEKQIQKLHFGLELDGKKLKKAKVKKLDPNTLQIILKEGRKRQIRRMCEAVGLQVTSLKRVRIGQLKLGNLPPGKWRFLKNNEKI